jgi:hypothetical protein
MTKYKLVVMDYIKGKVFVYKIKLDPKKNTDKKIEKFIIKQGHDHSNCHHMTTKEKKPIIKLSLKFQP